MRRREVPIPLIIQPHPKEYTGYEFITLIQYKKEHYLTIVDNYDGQQIKTYWLDRCAPEGVDEKFIIEIAYDWYENRKTRYPISFEFSRLGFAKEATKIHKIFTTEYVARVIGPMPSFPMEEITSIKRRKKKGLPLGMQVHQKTLILIDGGKEVNFFHQGERFHWR